MLAAAHRLAGSHGRWLLAFDGGVSAGWGALAAYALVFGVTLLVLAGRLWRRHRETGPEPRSA